MIQITLWGEKVNEINENMCETISKPLIVVIISTLVKKFKGNQTIKYPIPLQQLTYQVFRL